MSTLRERAINTSEIQLALDAPAFRAAEVCANDEAERFPEEEWEALVSAGYLRHIVPVSCGGRLVHLEDLLFTGRAIASRDLTVAVAVGQCLLGALPIWLAGDEAQRSYQAKLILAGGAGALALTEEEHGSDLASCETRAVRHGDGFRLDGRKWAINNATRGRWLTVLARSELVGGATGMSLLWLDKATLPASACQPTARLRTHGIRGADISGVVLDDVILPASALVGRPGYGLGLVLETFRVSRTLCAAFSLGGAETCLRLALAFARERRLYGAPAAALPAVRSELCAAYVDLRLADAFAVISARALSCLPDEMGLLSAAVKIRVPELAIDAARRASTVLGARHYLREGPYAIVQKMVRDIALIPLFDGSVPINCQQLASLSLAIVHQRVKGTKAPADLSVLCDLRQPPPPFSFRPPTPGGHRDDSLLGALHTLAARPTFTSDPALSQRLAALVAARDRLDRETLAAPRPLVKGDADAALRAHATSWLLAGASLAHLAASEGGGSAELLASGLATLGLRRVVRAVAPGHPSAEVLAGDADAEQAAFADLCAHVDDERLLSVRPLSMRSDPL